jgi:NitT/TauT family transport system permease protein
VRIRESHRVIAARVAVIGGVLAIWQLTPFGLSDPLTFVPLSEAFDAAWSLFKDGELGPEIRQTASSIVIAFLIAAVGGFAIGLGLWRFPTANRLLSPYLTSYYALPVIVFYPLLIVLFGLSRTPVVVLAAGWAIVAVIVGTVAGLNGLPDVYFKVARVYRLNVWQAILRVYIPGAAPLIFSGMRLAAGYAISGVIAAEFLLSPEGGLGYRVSYYYSSFETANMYGCILVVVLFATIATTVLRYVERKLVEQR